MASKTYRVDYQADGKTVVRYVADRRSALTGALKLSRRFGAAYAIATDAAGCDTGQRVYHNGAFSHQDEAF